MKIAFFTEGDWQGQVPRNNQNMRTEMAWMCALNADHYNIHGGTIEGEYDLGICIIPKNNPTFSAEKLRLHCKKLAYMQEGPHWYFQDYSMQRQIWFSNTLQEMDFLFVHNKTDKKYFEGLTGKECRIMPSLMIEDSIDYLGDKLLPGKNKANTVMIGGNFCNWYGGFDSYMIAQEFNCDISVPSMGRKIEGEDQLPRLNHLPYMSWVEWIKELSKYKYGVHLMRTHAAGTFALNCAYLGIPCIGYEGLDTQMICHPETTVKLGDLSMARKIAKRLNTDEEFYNKCSENAKLNYKEKYSEKQYLDKTIFI
jgi:hypothetical protein